MTEYVVRDSIIVTKDTVKSYEDYLNSLTVMPSESNLTLTIYRKDYLEEEKEIMKFKVLAGEMFEEIVPSFNKVYIETSSEARILLRRKQ